jgi:hypothetical protein
MNEKLYRQKTLILLKTLAFPLSLALGSGNGFSVWCSKGRRNCESSFFFRALRCFRPTGLFLLHACKQEIMDEVGLSGDRNLGSCTVIVLTLHNIFAVSYNAFTLRRNIIASVSYPKHTGPITIGIVWLAQWRFAANFRHFEIKFSIFSHCIELQYIAHKNHFFNLNFFYKYLASATQKFRLYFRQFFSSIGPADFQQFNINFLNVYTLWSYIELFKGGYRGKILLFAKDKEKSKLL